MKHFLKIASNADVGPLLAAVQRQPGLWNQNDLRTTHPQTPHSAADDIWLWFNKTGEGVTPADAFDDLQTVAYPAWTALPQARPLVFDLMRRVEATQLGRCLITRLAPGAVIPAHVDEGAPVSFYTRFQIALQSAPGCNFHIDGESACFKPGDVWMVNNTVEHSVINNSADDRIVLIADLRCQ